MRDSAAVTLRAPNLTSGATDVLPKPIFDTAGAHAASRHPKSLLDNYRHRASEVWLSPAVSQAAEQLTSALAARKGPVWTTLIGPFGFGKSATATALWHRLDCAGALAVPPLSSTNFGDLLEAVAATLAVAAGDRSEDVRKAYMRAIGKERRYDSKQGFADAAVEFLRILCGPDGIFEAGVALCIDEAQQLLGPLDPEALQTLRAFVWGLRTERVNCAVVLSLDPLLHRRLDRWASDILHRIADSGQILDLRTIYDSSFVVWLWERWHKGLGITNDKVLENDLAIALGQYVEREDLANGPRTIVEVFRKIINEPRGDYGLYNFVHDLIRGEFRFFAGERHAQTLIASVLDDAWINERPDRRRIVELLAAFPNGCPAGILNKHFPDQCTQERTRRELFGPLLVNADQGPALEALQRIRRRTWELDELLLRCWETLPGLASLLNHGPRLLLDTMVDWWFGNHPEACGRWRKLENDEAEYVHFDGEFDSDYPDRRLRVEAVRDGDSFVANTASNIVIRLVITSDGIPKCRSEIPYDVGLPITLSFELPLLSPLEDLAPSIERYRKFLDPEPIRPIHLLAALSEIKRHLDEDDLPHLSRQRCETFMRETRDVLTSMLLHGGLSLDSGGLLELVGAQLMRGLATQALRKRFPDYSPIRRIPNWRRELEQYRKALEAPEVRFEQRMGQEPIAGDKGAVLRQLGQRSIAAGDSFVRSLGGLLHAEGVKMTYRLWFTPHALECWALMHLEQEPQPASSLTDALRRHGCSTVEAEEVVALLHSRGAVMQADNGFLIKTECNGNSTEPAIANAVLAKSTDRAMEDGRFDALDHRLVDVLAQLRALETLSSPPGSSMATHISAHIQALSRRVQTTIDRTRDLRKSIASKEAGHIETGHILETIDRRTGEVENTSKLIVREHRFVQQWLNATIVLNGLERRAARLKPCADGTLDTLLDQLDRCVAQWKETFAINAAKALPRSEEFLKEIKELDLKFSERVLEQRIAFDLRRRELVQLIGWASEKPAPWGLDGDDPTPFEALDEWALEAAHAAHSRLNTASVRNSWRDPESTGVGFSELYARLGRTLDKASMSAATIDEVITLVQRLMKGIRSAYSLERGYADPDAPPDFGDLARAYHAGEVEIVVRPKSGRGK